ncbi:MAG: hypothetical protein J5523_06365 [Muribaculaceae bacterium]|nr:hypothetical protein [Muribaculaceae bacterium]
MGIKNLYTSLLMTCCVALSASAYVYHEQTSKVTNFDYSTYEFTYVEDGVTKTAKLTDEATTPEHMAALIKAIYTDPTIPGIHYAYDFNGTQSRKIDYNAYARERVNPAKNYVVPWDVEDQSVVTPNPNQDGMTLLMVNISEDWYRSYFSRYNDRPKDMLNDAVTSIKLMTHFTRVNDPVNPGYLYSFDGTTNRFFVISKGKPRITDDKNGPFYRLFEQISPVRGDGGHTTDDFINEIKAGHPYPCYHDCTNVLGFNGAGYDHWFTISNTGEAYTLKNLSIFIPDRRLEYETKGKDNVSDYDFNHQIFKNYENADSNLTIMPKVLLYTADLHAEAVPSDQAGYYQVNLSWNTSFTHENLGVDVPQQFYVYIVENGNRIRLASVEQPTTEYSHSYLVQQTTDPQTISYIITAHPINYYEDGSRILDEQGNPYITISAESPVRTVTIPGHSPFFTQISEYRSRYDVQSSTKQYNVYKNIVSIRPTSAEDYASIKNNTEKYDVIRTDAKDNKAIIATVQFSPIEGTTKYNYTVVYNNGTQDLSLTFDETEPVTSGTLESFEDATVLVIDRFTASTLSNNQSDKYTYSFEQIEGDTYYNYSNRFVVPVYKTTNNVSGYGINHDEFLADIDHSAKASPNNTITFSAINDPAANLVEYEIRRLKSNNFKNYDKIGKAENFNNSGQYYVYALNESNNLNELVEQSFIGTEGGNLTALDINQSSTNQRSNYVPVISTRFNGDINKPNTYGCDIQAMSYPQVNIVVDDLVKTNPMGSVANPVMGYAATIKINPSMPKDIKHVYYYRLWRIMDDYTNFDDETLLNKATSLTDDSWQAYYEEIKEFYPGNGEVYVVDNYLDKALNNNDKKVTYLVRLYATNVEANDNTLMAPTDNQGKDYFIAEKKVTVTYNESITTAINDVLESANVISVTYYNLMGVASDKPFNGLNVVVTRYDNGKSTVQKVVK